MKKQATMKKLFQATVLGSLIFVVGCGEEGNKQAPERYDAIKRMEQCQFEPSKKVVVFTKSTCGWCTKMKDRLQKKNVDYQEIPNLETDPKSEELKNCIAKYGEGVPFLIVDNKVINVNSYSVVDKALAPYVDSKKVEENPSQKPNEYDVTKRLEQCQFEPSKKVVVFTKSTCGWCTKMKERLQKKNVDYQEIPNLETDPKSEELKNCIAKYGEGVPFLIVDNKAIDVNDYSVVDKALAPYVNSGN